MPRGVKKGADTKKFDSCVTIKSSANQGRKSISIRTPSVTQACQVKLGAEENRYKL